MTVPDLEDFLTDMDEAWFAERLEEWGPELLVRAFFEDPRHTALDTLYRFLDLVVAEEVPADVWWRLYERAANYLRNPPYDLPEYRKRRIEIVMGRFLLAMSTIAADLHKREVRRTVLERLEEIQSDRTTSEDVRRDAENCFAELVGQWAKNDESLIDAAIVKLRGYIRCDWNRCDLVRALIRLNRRDDKIITPILEGLEKVGSWEQPDLVKELLERVETNDRRVLSWLVRQLRKDFSSGVQLLLSQRVREQLGDETVFAVLVESLEDATTPTASVRGGVSELLHGFGQTVLTQPDGRRRWARFLISLADHGNAYAREWALNELVELVPDMVQANEDINEIVQTVLRHAGRERDDPRQAPAIHYALKLARMLGDKKENIKTIVERLMGFRVAILGPSQVAQVPSLTRPDFAMIRDSFNSLSQKHALVYKPEDLERYHNALWAHVGTGSHRHFVILAGPSGTGKTKMAQIYAAAVLGFTNLEELNDSNHFRLVSVRPEWTDARDIMGYYNPLAKEGEGEYIATPVLELVLEANNQKDAPFFLVLDEMNIAHVEYYFSDILSAMESGAPIKLHSKTIEIKNERSNEVLRAENGEVTIPENLFITGTINVDETTHEISPKVLDRAYVLKLSCDWELFYQKSNLKDLSKDKFEELFGQSGVIRKTAEIMEKAGPAFGYRTAEDIFRYLLNGKAESSELDWLFESKILPKIKGSDTERLKEALGELATLAKQQNLTNTLRHLEQMQKDLDQKGFVKFVPM